MCGRYILLRPDAEKLLAKMGVPHPSEWASRYNISPGTDILAVRKTSVAGGFAASNLRWGLISPWSAARSAVKAMPMARIEGVAKKPAFRDSFRTRRCLLPASGYYEWTAKEGSRQPWFIRFSGDEPFFIGAIWEKGSTVDGASVETCAVLTTEANTRIKEIHHRMPVIVTPDSAPRWLEPAALSPSESEEFARPFSPAQMALHSVSTYVNSAANEGPRCLEPASHSTDGQLGLGW